MNKVELSVIIANRNGGKFLEECLSSLFAELSEQFEVIVVDDASEDDSMPVLKKFAQEKRLQVIALPTRIGAAEARNRGVHMCQGNFLFFLDSDTTVKPGWVQKVLNFFEQYPHCGMAQVKILRKHSRIFDYAGDYMSPFGFLVDRARMAEDIGQYDQVEPVFSGKSAALLARKTVFDEIGGFDADFIIFLEDTDIMWRTWLAGYTVLFFPDVTVYHAYGTKDKSFDFYIKNKVHYHGSRNTLLTHMKNWSFGRVLFVIPIQIAVWTLLGSIFLIKGDTFKGRTLLRGIGDALLLAPRILKKRSEIQRKRKISDAKLMQQVGIQQGIAYYFGKAKSYILGTPF